MSDFGDYEPADAYDADDTIATEWIALRLHELRDWIDRMAGGPGLPPFDTLDDTELGAAMGIAERLVAAVGISHDPDVDARLIHEAIRLRGVGLPTWEELPDDERAVAVALIGDVIRALELEGRQP